MFKGFKICDPSQLDALLSGSGAHKLYRARYQVGQIHPLNVQIHLVGLKLGQVQDIIDNSQKRLPRRDDRFDQMVLIGIQIGFLQQFGHADHTVERGAQFVAHGCKKLGFGMCCGLRLLLGKGQFFGMCYGLGHVAFNGDEDIRGPVRVQDRNH